MQCRNLSVLAVLPAVINQKGNYCFLMEFSFSYFPLELTWKSLTWRVMLHPFLIGKFNSSFKCISWSPLLLFIQSECTNWNWVSFHLSYTCFCHCQELWKLILRGGVESLHMGLFKQNHIFSCQLTEPDDLEIQFWKVYCILN